DTEYRNWQNSLSGFWTNAIKPLIPIGQAYNPSSTEITTAAEVDEFFDRLRTNQNPASITGYRGASFWRADTKPANMWTAVRTNLLGDGPGLPNLTLQPQSRSVPAGTSNVSFTAWGTGSKPFYYRWRFNGANIPGATSPNLTVNNVQFSHAGSYSVVISNISGMVTSQSATLNVTEPPVLLNIAAVTGARSAIISWTSPSPSSSQVEFGSSPALGLVTAEDARPTTNHSVLVTGLQPGTIYHYAVVSRTATNTNRSAGWSFSTAGELVVDNTAADFTGSWSTGTSSLDKYGADYRFVGTVGGGSTASAIFTPIINTPGLYDVFVWHPAGSNRTTNAPVVINYTGGAAMAKVNQTTGGGGWRQVGTNLLFRAGSDANVRIANNAFESNKVVVADAVRLVYRDAQDMPSGPVIPEWWSQHYFGGPVNPEPDHDGDGHPTWAEYLVGTHPKNAASRLMLWSEPAAGNSLAIYFNPALPSRRYELEEQSVLGGGWTGLNSVPQVNSTTGVGAFAITNTQAGVRFYRLRVEWNQ
ncbi:MAG TPA: fibronectin type III domain-containing protein, partial [Verrucomicrobiae bacterium]|nr:fibronectin type III domain-containing protein [Verrucomicrobiae bacterium]